MLTNFGIVLSGLHPEVWAAQHLVRCDWPGHPGGAGAAVELREELGDRQAPREDGGSPLHDCQIALWRHVPWTPGKLLIWKAPFQFLVCHYLAALFRPGKGILLKASSLVNADSLHFLVKGSQETFRQLDLTWGGSLENLREIIASLSLKSVIMVGFEPTLFQHVY